MKIANNIDLNAINYANQGNSIIGIRGSGKTYTATKVAEELMTAGIPIVAFDPTGVWQNLRFGNDNQNGFPVVVAGGFSGDVALTEENAVTMLDAAMKAGISLIIDLQGISTSNKSQWLRIVSDCVQHLNGHNQQYGLRHVFIEEAAEFCPQRVQPGGALTYSRIETMARIGRNFGIGYTLINQRAEEISKAIFEICEMVMVHRQSGKNSLNSIKDWLTVRGQQNKEIIESLPGLKNGECWVIDNEQEIQISVNTKQTFHPDPKAGKNVPVASNKADIARFVQLIKETIEPSIKTAKATLKKEKSEEFQKKFEDLVKRVEALELALSEKVQIPAEVKKEKSIQPVIQKTVSKTTVTSGAKRMLKAAGMFYPGSISRSRMALLAGLSPKSGSFGTYLATLSREGHIIKIGSDYKATSLGLKQVDGIESLSIDPQKVVEMWCQNVGNGSGAARILRYLSKIYPKGIDKSSLAEKVDMSAGSGSFGTYLATLKRNDLIVNNGKNYKAHDSLFN